MEIATAFVSIRPQADGSFESEVTSMVSGLPDAEIPVIAEADTADAEAEIGGIEGGEAEVTVTPDGIEETQAEVDNLTESTSALGDAAQNAVGGMSGLGGAAGGAASSFGATGAAVGAAAVALGGMISSGLDAASALERFNLVAGDLAGSVRTIQVGGLSGDIGELALQLGSSDEAMLNATASFVGFAETTGASNSEIVAASDNINALALRAVALNPALGDAGEVATRLSTGLARGGRALTQFQIGLTSAEINARALADTGKSNAADLTQFEKAAAGAALATERLGNSLGADFQAGSENSATRVAAMKEQLGELGEQVGIAAVPALSAFADSLAPVITSLGSAAAATENFGALLALLDPQAEGASGAVSSFLTQGLTPYLDLLPGAEEGTSALGSALGSALAAPANEAEAAIDSLAQSIDEYLSGLFDLPGAQREARQSITELAAANFGGSWDDQAVAMENVVETTAKVISIQQSQGAGQRALDTTIYANIAALAQARDQGRITGAQFDTLSAQVAGVPHEAPVHVHADNVPETVRQLTIVRTAVDGIPTDLAIRVSVPNLGAIAADVNGAAAALRSLRQAGESGIGADLGRPTGAGASAAAPIVVQTYLDGDLVATNSAEHNRRFDIATGFEQ